MYPYFRSLPAVLALIAAVVFFTIDLAEQFGAEDYPMEWHHAFEWIAFACILYLSLRELARMDALRRVVAEQSSTIEQLSGRLTGHIEGTFERWQLTNAEREVAWLLLKGFAFAEIAALRGVREKSVRQQAATIYKKAGLKGRAELVAFFLEDLIARQDGDAQVLSEENPTQKRSL